MSSWQTLTRNSNHELMTMPRDSKSWAHDSWFLIIPLSKSFSKCILYAGLINYLIHISLLNMLCWYNIYNELIIWIRILGFRDNELPRSVRRRPRVGLSPCLIPAAVMILYCCLMHQVSLTKCHNVAGSLHASLHWAALWGRVSARPCCVASLAWAACPPLLTPRPSHPWHRD